MPGGIKTAGVSPAAAVMLLENMGLEGIILAFVSFNTINVMDIA